MVDDFRISELVTLDLGLHQERRFALLTQGLFHATHLIHFSSAVESVTGSVDFIVLW